ncbi:hypothetical protein K469DRAFT_581275 [Zopfia rhizophila CBS 207.26]|uniref:SnoaL-like domain-containing protein n=1 Tax=Zopfia rhizophila CBS 207.26 TaxID=1314779 RepID=A0A6A6DW42_9PEZI|nr:hypothetical protein K469DRAFT_581275 [Zopfia rhizophila CBS 207.26]
MSKLESIVEEIYATLKDQPKHTPQQVEAVKQVLRLLTATFVTEEFDITNKLVPLHYKQHDPLVGDGRDSIFEFKNLAIAQAQKETDKKVGVPVVSFKRILVDGDYVIAHSHVIAYEGDRGTAVVDMFRYVNGEFVEHWDVLQQVPANAKNSNTMF